MRLREVMSSPAETIAPDESVRKARDRMSQEGIHHLVVMERGEPIGVVSVWGLADAEPDAPVRSEVGLPPVVMAPNDTLKTAANRLRGHGVGTVVVMEGEKVVGVVTTADLLELVGRGSEKPIPHAIRPRTRRPWTGPSKGRRVGSR